MCYTLIYLYAEPTGFPLSFFQCVLYLMGNSAVGMIKNYHKNLIVSVVTISYAYVSMHACLYCNYLLQKSLAYCTWMKGWYFLEIKPLLRLGEQLSLYIVTIMVSLTHIAIQYQLPNSTIYVVHKLNAYFVFYKLVL